MRKPVFSVFKQIATDQHAQLSQAIQTRLCQTWLNTIKADFLITKLINDTANDLYHTEHAFLLYLLQGMASHMLCNGGCATCIHKKLYYCEQAFLTMPASGYGLSHSVMGAMHPV